MSRRHQIVPLALLAVAFAATPAFAGKGGHALTASPTCTVANGVVTATGLPTGEVINFMVTDSSGTWGWVLGFTSDGRWAVTAPAASGYQFVSRTSGQGGSRYTVFASC